MRECKNCLWREECGQDERCEHYTPIKGFDKILKREYEEILKMRVEEYAEIVAEMED